MMLADGGGGSVRTSPVTQNQLAPQQPVRQDAQVEEAVSETVRFAQTHLADPAYVIQQTLADPSLDQGRKDEYVARIAELAGGEIGFCTIEGTFGPEQAGKILNALEDIGTAYTGPATPELRTEVTEAFGRAVDSGRLDADDVYDLVDPARIESSDGVRQLLTGVNDGAVLNRVADRLLTDAHREGYDINDSTKGVSALVAAADVAGMAADKGWSASANAVMQEIAAHPEKVAGDLTLTQAMMATSVMGSAMNGPVDGRTGFDALAGLVNGVTDAKLQPATDALFRDLVRSDTDNAVGGIDQSTNLSGGLNDLGAYFERHVDRLVEDDWRGTNTGGPETGIVADFAEKVMLHEDYGRGDQTAQALSGYIADKADVIANPDAAMDNRSDAARGLGTLLGSLQQAGSRHVEEAGSQAKDGLGLLRQVIDLAGDKVASKAGPVGSAAYGATMDRIADALEGVARGAAQDDIDGAMGELIKGAQAVRSAIRELDGDILDAFDQRAGQYQPK